MTTATKTATLTATPVIFHDGSKGYKYEVWSHTSWHQVGIGYSESDAVGMAQGNGYTITRTHKN